MRIEYDARIDAAYIYFTDNEETTASDTIEVELPNGDRDSVMIDVDGPRLLGIDVMDASKRLPTALLESAEQL
jgi:uncharacterized protein YuzE